MSPELNHLRLEQLQATLSSYADLVKRQAPSRGWLKLIREALGRTERQQAQRLGITGSTLHKSEQSEADDRITLGQLRKLADGLDCELVYALVPRRPLTEVVQERARAIAMEEVGGVAHTMGLEDQRPGADRLRKQVERRTEELLRGRWSDLWR
jgi:predicted DNA-binding mobile mystery protein A